jgi:hypothetical protein
MNTDYNVVSMCAEAIEGVLPRETGVNFAIWIKAELLDSCARHLLAIALLQRTPRIAMRGRNPCSSWQGARNKR